MKISGSAIWCLRSRVGIWSGSLTSWQRSGSASMTKTRGGSRKFSAPGAGRGGRWSVTTAPGRHGCWRSTLTTIPSSSEPSCMPCAARPPRGRRRGPTWPTWRTGCGLMPTSLSCTAPSSSSPTVYSGLPRLRTGNGWTSAAQKPDLDRSLTTKPECETSHSWPGLSRPLLARVRIQPLQLVRVDGPHHPWREHPLEEAPDPPGAIPGRADLHERVAVSGGDRGRGDHAGTGIGLGQDPARFRLVHLHPVLAGPTARGHREPRDGAGPRAAGFHPEIREGRGQETRVMIAHVRDIAVDRIRRRIDHAFGADHDFPHAGLSITAVPRAHTRFECVCSQEASARRRSRL